MPKLASLDDLLVYELQDIYDAERQVFAALPTMTSAVRHAGLRASLEDEVERTEGQIGRLEQAFRLLGLPATGRRCEGMAVMLEEGRKTIEGDSEVAVRDAVLIGVAQKVKHYQIAAYGCACTYAEMLGYEQVHELLGQSLDEKEITDQKLTTLAEQVIGPGGEARMVPATPRDR